MRVRHKTIFGRIDGKGELKMPPTADFCALHKGAAVKISIDVMPLEPTERMTNFFFGYVVKEMRNAFESLGNDYTEEQTYNEIRRNCPLFFEEKRIKGVWRRREKEWEDLDCAEAVAAIEWIQRWASIEFKWVIEDAK